MVEALAVFAGVAVGILASLVPGLHAALALTFLVAFGLPHWLGPGPATCFLAAAAGAILYVRRLGAVYHPSATGDEAATLDVAQRLTRDGRGPDALRLMVTAVDLSWLPIAALVCALVLFALAGVDLAKGLAHGLAWLGLPLVLVWAVHTCVRGQKPVMTLVGLALTGLCGYAVLHHPQLAGNEHQLAPLMGGLFGIPMMLAVLAHGNPTLAPQGNPSNRLEGNPILAVLGGVIGTLAGFFAGIGAGSLVGMAGSLAEDDHDYLMMATAGEAAKESSALLLILVAGIGHTGEAQLLGRVAGSLSLGQALLVFVATVIGALAGRAFVFAFESSYLALIRWKSPAFWAKGVIGLALWQIWLTGQLATALPLALACTAIALFNRQQALPLQVSFAALALPLVVQDLGFVPALNQVLFGA